MDAKTKKRMIIGVSIAVLLGVGGYVAFKYVKAKRDKKNAEDDAAKPATPTTSTPTPSGSSGSSSTNTSEPSAPSNTAAYEAALNAARSSKALAFSFEGKVYSSVTGRVVPNPFTSQQQIATFQSFVKNRLKDNSIGAIDGKWGVKTATAFIKYASQYYANK